MIRTFNHISEPEIEMARKRGEKDRWEIWQDKRFKWRWRRIAPNGNIVGSSSMGYQKRIDCERNAARFGCGS